MNTILTFLDQNRQRLDLDHYGIPAQLSCVVVTPRFRASSHVVFLILPPGKSEPVLVAKIPRLAGAHMSLEREAANLQAIQAWRADGFDTIPRLITFERYHDRSILIETALVGEPMDPTMIRRNFAGCCEIVTDWLVNVHQARPSFTQTSSSWFKRLVEQPIDYFRNVFPLTMEEEELLERTWKLVLPLRHMNLPLVFEHGDLSHPNVMLLKNGKPGVVDWELADPQGLPACDLFFFLTYIAFARHNARSSGKYLPAFQTAFFGRATWARSYIRRYAEGLQLPLHGLTPLFVLSWVRYMAGLLIRLDNANYSQGQFGSETATWLRANRYYKLWQYTISHLNELDWHDLPRETEKHSRYVALRGSSAAEK